MKRRRAAPLLALQEPPTYVMDSSAWFDVDDLSDAKNAWITLFALIDLQRLAAPLEVIDELKMDDALWPRLHPHEAKLRSGRSDEAYLLLAGTIASEHPAMCGLRSRKTRADPFVIALAEIEGWTVVTNETARHRPSRKIPTVCLKRHVACVTLAQMLSDAAGII